MDVGHPKHVSETQNCVFLLENYMSATSSQINELIFMLVAITCNSVKINGRVEIQWSCNVKKSNKNRINSNV